MYLSVDVGGTYIKYGWIVNDKIVKKGKILTPYTNYEEFDQLISEIWYSEEKTKFGLCISHPGTIDHNYGYIYQGGSIRYNSKRNLKELYEERFQVPVSIENDARCAAIAEMKIGNMRNITNGIVLTFGTGIGCSLIIDNEIYRGSNLIAGEVSGIVTKDIRKFGLDSILGRQLGIGKFCENVCRLKGESIRDGKQVMDWIMSGDIIASQAFREYCQLLSSQLFNMQLLVDPQKVCIGGGISENKFFINSIKESMSKYYNYFPVEIPKIEIEECMFHNDANILGAYYHLLNQKI